MNPMIKRAATVFVLAILAVATLPAQTQVDYAAVRVDAVPTVAFPLLEDIDYFGPSLGANLQVSFATPFLPMMSIGAETGYSVNLLQGAASDTLSTIRGGAGLRVTPFLAPWLMISLGGGGGAYYSFLNAQPDQAGYNPYVFGSGGITVVLGSAKRLSIGIEGIYRNYLGFLDEVGAALSVALHAGRRIAPPGPAPVVVPEPEIPVRLLRLSAFDAEPLFPTLSKYYDEHPFGTVQVTNPNTFPVHDVQVRFFMNTYMDSPKECARIETLAAEETVEVPLYGLFNTSILDIYEQSSVGGRVSVRYVAQDADREHEESFTLTVLDRNALVWEDDRRAAAFVTSKDPVVMRFAKNVMSLVDLSNAINGNLYRAMAVFTALEAHGLTYNVDPSSAYADLSETQTVIDYLQYPRQTLDYRAGDCDDITVLTTALLESVGVPTAFVTIPGHIFMAFDLGVPEAEARRLLVNPESLIFREDTTWVPVEITQLGDGFLRAWETGASEWRSAVAEQTAALYPVHEAWSTYEAVAFFEDTDIRFPSEDEIAAAFEREAANLVGFQLAPRLAALEARLESSRRPFQIYNGLGVLYARYGQSENAMEMFQSALELAPEYVQAVLNMGNLYLLDGEYEAAVEQFERAVTLDEQQAAAYLSLSLAYRRMGDYSSSLANYNRVRSLSPELAAEYSYLGPDAEDTARASSSVIGPSDLRWMEE